jgi:hypothetical protein
MVTVISAIMTKSSISIYHIVLYSDTLYCITTRMIIEIYMNCNFFLTQFVPTCLASRETVQQRKIIANVAGLDLFVYIQIGKPRV